MGSRLYRGAMGSQQLLGAAGENHQNRTSIKDLFQQRSRSRAWILGFACSGPPARNRRPNGTSCWGTTTPSSAITTPKQADQLLSGDRLIRDLISQLEERPAPPTVLD